MMKQKYESIAEQRMFLRNVFFSNSDMVNLLVEIIGNKLYLLDATFNPNTMSIELKIKKSVMKKDKTFIHNTLFYYPAIAQSFISFFNSKEVYNFFTNYISTYNIVEKQKMIDTYYALSNLTENYASMLFNSVAVLDNIIIINL